MKPIAELDEVALTAKLPMHGLARGDIGTVVLVVGNGNAYVVEFMTLTGKTIAVVTLEAGQVRPLGEREVPNARRLELATA